MLAFHLVESLVASELATRLGELRNHGICSAFNVCLFPPRDGAKHETVRVQARNTASTSPFLVKVGALDS